MPWMVYVLICSESRLMPFHIVILRYFQMAWVGFWTLIVYWCSKWYYFLWWSTVSSDVVFPTLDNFPTEVFLNCGSMIAANNIGDIRYSKKFSPCAENWEYESYISIMVFPTLNLSDWFFCGVDFVAQWFQPLLLVIYAILRGSVRVLTIEIMRAGFLLVSFYLSLFIWFLLLWWYTPL